MTCNLSMSERKELLEDIQKAIIQASGGTGDASSSWGGIGAIDDHLDQLIAIAQEIQTDLPEAYMAEVLENVCSHCGQQASSGYCTLRYIGVCTLYRCAVPVINTIRQYLEQQHKSTGIPHPDEGPSAAVGD